LDAVTAFGLYAISAPGLEALTANELLRLGLPPTETEPGGVAFNGTLFDLGRANLWLRTASRVLVRLGSFHARALGELERKATRLLWRDWLAPGIPIKVRATCRKSRLFHQRAVAERIVAASGRAGEVAAAEETEESSRGAQLVIVRVFRDTCTVSLDGSGELLHRRGYRLAAAKAPLRETLAAALLLESGWDPTTPLVDPFCGSGTIPIEGALLARGIPPGLSRDFSCRHWVGWDEARWRALLDIARENVRDRAPAPIMGADRDPGAIGMAVENAARAGVEGDIEFRRAALSTLTPPDGIGALVSNPPYGVRVGERGDLRDLYARLGQLARERLVGWRVTLLVPAVRLERETGLAFRDSLRTRNGGIPVRVTSAEV
jgi:putative N6-adenine-specific DNA methylase